MRDYRSIHDSGDIGIEPRKTLLVGVDETGIAVLTVLQQIKAPEDVEVWSAPPTRFLGGGEWPGPAGVRGTG
ncbi:hypothetical protein [Nocardiopsis metallicus]|uniref:Uncharacterized protein n=1 Tax=Nocardiopsis metallicus TaxID=179819 RepID=A0A840WBZ0_9ACTN|nr:hypothetical protein [Nocardiopsis metallicus]MBB5494550.1 hypothetical protein [Nocardiopsis metallicus]